MTESERADIKRMREALDEIAATKWRGNSMDSITLQRCHEIAEAATWLAEVVGQLDMMEAELANARRLVLAAADARLPCAYVGSTNARCNVLTVQWSPLELERVDEASFIVDIKHDYYVVRGIQTADTAIVVNAVKRWMGGDKEW